MFVMKKIVLLIIVLITFHVSFSQDIVLKPITIKDDTLIKLSTMKVCLSKVNSVYYYSCFVISKYDSEMQASEKTAWIEFENFVKNKIKDSACVAIGSIVETKSQNKKFWIILLNDKTYFYYLFPDGEANLNFNNYKIDAKELERQIGFRIEKS